jgi:hypothetical protein
MSQRHLDYRIFGFLGFWNISGGAPDAGRCAAG